MHICLSASLIYKTTASIFFRKDILVCLCPHPLYTRSPHPLYIRPYRTIQKNTVPHTGTRKTRYHIPDEYHTNTIQKIPYHIPEKYRTAYDTGTLPYHTVPKIPYHITDHTIPAAASTHNRTKSTGHTAHRFDRAHRCFSCARDSVGRGAGGWCLGSRKAVAPEMDTPFVADRFSYPKTSD